MRQWKWYATGLAIGIPLTMSSLPAADWPQWGHDNNRNMVSLEQTGPTDFNPGKPLADKDQIDPGTTKNIKWASKLGSAAYGNPVIAGGKVFVGTNNEPAKDPTKDGDAGVLLCLDEATGKPLWQYVAPKLPSGKASDWELIGICSSPTVDGDRVYLVSNRCEVVCLTTAGKPGANGAIGEAEVVWHYDMRDELGVFPHNMTASSVLIVGDRVYASTSNAVDWTNKHIPSPSAPALICLDKKTGKLIGREQSGISARTYHSNWSSPAFGKAGDKEMLIFGAGDGFCYAFEPVPVDGVLKEIWRCDCNPPERKLKEDGTPRKYGTDTGPSEIIATPVILNNRVYVGTGQDPEAQGGKGCLTCIDATKTGDVTSTGVVWTNKDVGRSLSTCAIAGGLLFTADFSGVVYCLDPETGTAFWTHDTAGAVWGSPVLIGGKLYVGNEPGTLTILEAGKEEKLVKEVAFDAPIYSSPVTANGVMYVGTDKYLFAIPTTAK